MQKNGFTIVELIVSVAIMFTVMLCAFPLIMKKPAKTSQIVKEPETFICAIGVNERNGECKFTPKSEFSQEFYEFEIVGGGAGGGANAASKAGSPGEAKVVYYPTLECDKENPITYVIRLGKGGEVGKNGGQTTIYKEKEGTYEVLEFAQGGITTNEVAANDDEKVGQSASLAPNTGLSSDTGKAGSAGSSGNSGGVVIKWW